MVKHAARLVLVLIGLALAAGGMAQKKIKPWMQWTLQDAGKVLLGSIFLTGQRFQDPPRIQLPQSSFDVQQVSRKRFFTGGSRLSYIVQVFNPADVPLLCQAKIYLGNQIVLQSLSQPVQATDPAVTGPAFLAGAILLEGLAAGSYVLEVAAIDPADKVAATQRVGFWIQ